MSSPNPSRRRPKSNSSSNLRTLITPVTSSTPSSPTTTLRTSDPSNPSKLGAELNTNKRPERSTSVKDMKQKFEDLIRLEADGSISQKSESRSPMTRSFFSKGGSNTEEKDKCRLKFEEEEEEEEEERQTTISFDVGVKKGDESTSRPGSRINLSTVSTPTPSPPVTERKEKEEKERKDKEREAATAAAASVVAAVLEQEKEKEKAKKKEKKDKKSKRPRTRSNLGLPTVVTSPGSPPKQARKNERKSKRKESDLHNSATSGDSEDEDDCVFEMDDDEDLVSPRLQAKKTTGLHLSLSSIMATSSDILHSVSPRTRKKEGSDVTKKHKKSSKKSHHKADSLDLSISPSPLRATPLILDEAIANLPRSSPRPVVSPRSPATSPREIIDPETMSSDDESQDQQRKTHLLLPTTTGSLSSGSLNQPSSITTTAASSVGSESASLSSLSSSFSFSPNLVISPRSSSGSSSSSSMDNLMAHSSTSPRSPRSPRNRPKVDLSKKKPPPFPPTDDGLPSQRPNSEEVQALIRLTASLKKKPPPLPPMESTPELSSPLSSSLSSVSSLDEGSVLSETLATEKPAVPPKFQGAFKGMLTLDLKRLKEDESPGSPLSPPPKPSPRTLGILRDMKQKLMSLERAGLSLSPRGHRTEPPTELPPKPQSLLSRPQAMNSEPALMAQMALDKQSFALLRSSSASDMMPSEPLSRGRSSSVSSPRGLIFPPGFDSTPPKKMSVGLVGADLVLSKSSLGYTSGKGITVTKRTSDDTGRKIVDLSVEGWASKPLQFDEWVEEEVPSDRTPLIDPGCKKNHFRVEYGRKGITGLPKSETIHILGSEDDVAHFAEILNRIEHAHYFGEEETVGPVIVTLENDSEKPQLRAIVRTKQGDERAIVSAKKDKIKAIQTSIPKLAPVKLTKTKDPELTQELLKFERQAIAKNFKFGLLYCKDGQLEEDAMFCNENGSADFDEFLEFLGEKIVLEGWTQFRGGLDVKTNTTGKNSIYTAFRGYELMFHCSTLLPFTPGDPQQLERKRHLGNDIVIIVFKEGDQPLDPNVFRTQFIHVWFVISKVTTKPSEGEEGKEGEPGKVYYRLEVASKAGVKTHKPYLPEEAIFEKNSDFRQFLLAKLINSERAALASPEFKTKSIRTRTMMLHNLVDSAAKKKPEKSKMGNFFKG